MALYKNNKQDGSTILIAGVGGENINVDSTLDSTSTNPVQNKIITEQFDIIDKILYKKYISAGGSSGSGFILSVNDELKLYDKIILFSPTTIQGEIIITYKDNTKENIMINTDNSPTIFVGENFSSIEVPAKITAIIYRCVDENEIQKLQSAFNKLEKQFNDIHTELMQTGIVVPNLINDLYFSFGAIDEYGNELVSKTGIMTNFSFSKNTDIVIKSIDTEIIFRTRYENENGEYITQSYSLNQENNYMQKITCNANCEYKISFSYPSESEIVNITDIKDKINIYTPNRIIDAGKMPVSNGNGTWSWKNPENEIQKMQLSWNGLTIDFYKQGRIVWMKVSGTLSADLAINNAFIDIIIPLDSFKPTVSDTMDIISGLYRFQVNAVEGTGFRIGQGKILSTETGTDITAGTELHFNRMYIC